MREVEHSDCKWSSTMASWRSSLHLLKPRASQCEPWRRPLCLERRHVVYQIHRPLNSEKVPQGRKLLFFSTEKARKTRSGNGIRRGNDTKDNFNCFDHLQHSATTSDILRHTLTICCFLPYHPPRSHMQSIVK